ATPGQLAVGDGGTEEVLGALGEEVLGGQVGVVVLEEGPQLGRGSRSVVDGRDGGVQALAAGVRGHHSAPSSSRRGSCLVPPSCPACVPNVPASARSHAPERHHLDSARCAARSLPRTPRSWSSPAPVTGSWPTASSPGPRSLIPTTR